MVAIHPGPAKIVVEGDAEARNRSVQFSASVPVRKKGLLDVLPGLIRLGEAVCY